MLWYAVAVALGLAYWRTEPPAAPARSPTAAAARPPLLNLSVDGVRTVRLVHGGRALVFDHQGGGWQVREPVDAPVPAGLIDAFMAALLGAQIIDRAGDVAGDLTPFGLGENATRIEVDTDQKPAVVIHLGAINPSGTAVYVRLVGERQVLLIGRNLAYYEEMLFQALPPAQVPAETAGPVGG